MPDMVPLPGTDEEQPRRSGAADPVVIVDEGRPDGAHRPLSGAPPYPGRAAASESAPTVTWIDGGTRLAITTWGSSSAPPVPTAAHVDGQRLALTPAVRDPGGGPVGLDLAASITVTKPSRGSTRVLGRRSRSTAANTTCHRPSMSESDSIASSSRAGEPRSSDQRPPLADAGHIAATSSPRR